MSGQLRRIGALVLAAAASFVACSLNPGVDLPKTGASNGTGGSVANGASGGTGGGAQAGGSSGSAGTAPGSGGDSPATGGSSASSGSGGVDVGAGGDDGAAGASGNDEPYANVTGVTVTGSEGSYVFNVSVESSDVDCSEFANWWEVLSEDGELLYRRILEHSHTDENGTSDANAPGNTFTRDGGPVVIAAGDSVLVRAHLSTGGYNGQVMRGSPSGAFTAAPEIDGDFAAEVEAEAPQPTGCQF